MLSTLNKVLPGNYSVAYPTTYSYTLNYQNKISVFYFKGKAVNADFLSYV